MRKLIASVAAFAAGMLFCGCSSGGTSLHCLAGDPHCGSVSHYYDLTVDPASEPASPVPVGGSATIRVTERACVGTASQSGPPPGVHLGCGTPFVPSALTIAIWNMSGPGTGKPCPITAVVSAKGAVTVTRSGPGDPVQYHNGTPGWCTVEVTDPGTADDGGNHPTAEFFV